MLGSLNQICMCFCFLGSAVCLGQSWAWWMGDPFVKFWDLLQGSRGNMEEASD